MMPLIFGNISDIWNELFGDLMMMLLLLLLLLPEQSSFALRAYNVLIVREKTPCTGSIEVKMHNQLEHLKTNVEMEKKERPFKNKIYCSFIVIAIAKKRAWQQQQR